MLCSYVCLGIWGKNDSPEIQWGSTGAQRQLSCPAALRGLIRPCLDVFLGNDLMVILCILSVVDDKCIIFIPSHEPFVENVSLPSHICNTSNHANKVHVFKPRGQRGNILAPEFRR